MVPTGWLEAAPRVLTSDPALMQSPLQIGKQKFTPGTPALQPTSDDLKSCIEVMHAFTEVVEVASSVSSVACVHMGDASSVVSPRNFAYFNRNGTAHDFECKFREFQLRIPMYLKLCFLLLVPFI